MSKIEIEPEISNAIQKVLASGIFVKGPQAELFEKEFAKFIGNQFAITTNSGTSALFLAYSMLKLQKGDEIIVP
ncbi:MAG TPA: DegT/DnrJ/EryC1/StrS family aminotransferase, partial [Prolixibacteraceae bacterium]|nr:DegT/DnrJ/EryC1/StrS family aminotransferase [Prolixibacteraceae bacterium]